MRGGIAVDDRGSLSFVNDFAFHNVRRFYVVSNHRAGFVRAWHAHRREAKYVTVVQGSAVVCAVAIDDWDFPTDRAAESSCFIRHAAIHTLHSCRLRQWLYVAYCP